MCELGTPTIRASDEGLIVSGVVVGECTSVRVELDLPSGASLSDSTPTDPPVGGERAWSVVFKPGDSVVIAACEAGTAQLTVRCEEGDDCSRSFGRLTIDCCPRLGPPTVTAGDECVVAGAHLLRTLDVAFHIEWPAGYDGDVNVEVAVWEQGLEDVFTHVRSVAAHPGEDDYTSADFTTPLNVPAGATYEGRVSITVPTSCARRARIRPFPVPRCDRDCPPAPVPADFFTIRDGNGVPVEDPEVECIDTPTALVTAGPAPGELEFHADTATGEVPVTEEPAPPRTVRVPLPPDGRQVTVNAIVGEPGCRGPVPVTLRRCGRRPDPPPPDDDDEVVVPPDPAPDDGETPPPPSGAPDICTAIRFVLLLMVGLLAVSLTLLLCPGITAGLLPEDKAKLIGLVASIVFFVLALIALAAWIVICRPNECDWIKLGWQLAFIVGVLFIYAGLCPGCSWFLAGVVGLALFVALFWLWLNRCRPSTCTVWKELFLMAFAFDIAAIFELAIAWCSLQSNTFWALVWMGAVLAFNTAVAVEVLRNNCLRG